MRDIDRRALEEARDRLDKVHGVLKGIEAQRDREDSAASLFRLVLAIFDGEVETDGEGAILPQHRGKAYLAEAVTQWLNQGGK